MFSNGFYILAIILTISLDVKYLIILNIMFCYYKYNTRDADCFF